MKGNKKFSDHLFTAMMAVAVLGIVIIFIVIIQSNYKIASDIMAAVGFWTMIFSIKPIHDKINKFLPWGKFDNVAWLLIILVFLALCLIYIFTTIGLYKTINLSPTVENYLTFIFMLVSIIIL